MFTKKEENLRLTIYKIEIVRVRRRTQYCARRTPKIILGAQFFSVTKGHVRSSYDPNSWGRGANFWRPVLLLLSSLFIHY